MGDNNMGDNIVGLQHGTITAGEHINRDNDTSKREDDNKGNSMQTKRTGGSIMR